MQENATPEGLTGQQEEAALLVAQDLLIDDQIAARVGVNDVTIWRWKRDPAFAARVAEHRGLWRERMTGQGLADLQNRIDAYNDRWRRLRQVIVARADDPELRDVPGGSTGMLVRTFKGIGGGERAEMVEEFAVDVGLLRELRELEKQAAQDLGQWVSKGELTGKNGSPLFRDVRDLSDDELAAIASRGSRGAAETTEGTPAA